VVSHNSLPKFLLNKSLIVSYVAPCLVRLDEVSAVITLEEIDGTLTLTTLAKVRDTKYTDARYTDTRFIG